MTRREAHFDAMLRHLGATYYQTLQGEASPSDVARALASVEREAARRRGGAGLAEHYGRPPTAGRWRIRDIMTTEVIAADKHTPSTKLARLMSEHHINAIPVVTGARRVAGVVSEADLLRTQHRPRQRAGVLRRPQRARAEGYTAGQLMTAPAITIHPDAPVGAAARRMTEHNLTLLPVVDAEGELMGVVSRRDLLRVFLRSDEDIAAEVRDLLTRVLLIDPDAVSVTASEGLVTLRGEIGQADLIPAALRLTADVDGVLGVIDRLGSRETATAGRS